LIVEVAIVDINITGTRDEETHWSINITGNGSRWTAISFEPHLNTTVNGIGNINCIISVDKKTIKIPTNRALVCEGYSIGIP
jgi:hypothetical protein